MNDKMNWKNVLTIGGAYTAYCIGAGFASGQETLQYYASWGGIYPFVLPALTFVLMFVICYGTFKTGYINRFPSPNVTVAPLPANMISVLSAMKTVQKMSRILPSTLPQ